MVFQNCCLLATIHQNSKLSPDPRPANDNDGEQIRLLFENYHQFHPITSIFRISPGMCLSQIQLPVCLKGLNQTWPSVLIKNRSFPGKSRLICIDFRLMLSLYFIVCIYSPQFLVSISVKGLPGVKVSCCCDVYRRPFRLHKA